jgi:hypothetical protein
MKYGLLINKSDDNKVANSYNIIPFQNEADVETWKGKVVPIFETKEEAQKLGNSISGMALSKAVKTIGEAGKAAFEKDSPTQINPNENQETEGNKTQDDNEETETEGNKTQDDNEETETEGNKTKASDSAKK